MNDATRKRARVIENEILKGISCPLTVDRENAKRDALTQAMAETTKLYNSAIGFKYLSMEDRKNPEILEGILEKYDELGRDITAEQNEDYNRICQLLEYLETDDEIQPESTFDADAWWEEKRLGM